LGLIPGVSLQNPFARPNSGSASDDAGRLNTWARARRYYAGNAPKPLTIKHNQPDDNIRMSARTIADTGVVWLAGKGNISLDWGEADATLADWFEDAWSQERQTVQFMMSAGHGAQTGHAFNKILPADATHEFPRVIVLEPEWVTPDLNPHDKDEVLGWTIKYPLPSRDGKAIYFRQLLPSDLSAKNKDAIIIDQESVDGGKTWVTTAENPWPYEFSPIVHCQNLPNPDDFWGIPDLTPEVLDLIDAYNRTLSNDSRINRMFKHPVPYLEGASGDQMKASNDRAVGAMIVVPQGAKLGLLQPQVNWDKGHLNKIEQKLEEATNIPQVSPERMSRLGSITGVALQVLYAPLMSRTDTKRNTYGPFKIETAYRFAVVGGQSPADRPTITWPSLLPADPAVDRVIWAADIAMGIVSKETVSGLAGYDWDAEQQAIADEKAAAPQGPELGPDGQPLPGQPAQPGSANGMPQDQVSGMLARMGAAKRVPNTSKQAPVDQAAATKPAPAKAPAKGAMAMK
jgi:hypothetical protein